MTAEEKKLKKIVKKPCTPGTSNGNYEDAGDVENTEKEEKKDGK